MEGTTTPEGAFQPTLPLRGATRRANAIGVSPVNRFNPRSPCGERPKYHHRSARPFRFNPRSPCGERPAPVVRRVSPFWFQPTLPLRGATYTLWDLLYSQLVFQPTLPLRGATRRRGRRPRRWSFNPRSPCGERPTSLIRCMTLVTFQPTLPLRGATERRGRFRVFYPFQPTLPLRGATSTVGVIADRAARFQPTLPLRGATGVRRRIRGSASGFNPRSPCGERRSRASAIRPWPMCFNPRSPCGERLVFSRWNFRTAPFQPTLPLRGATLSTPFPLS